jgi:hypothetical protein
MIKIKCHPEFEFKCKKDWEDLDYNIQTIGPTELCGIESRYCDDCEKSVYKIQSIAQIDFAMKNQYCVAIYFPKNRHEGMQLDGLPGESKPTLGLLRTAD